MKSCRFTGFAATVLVLLAVSCSRKASISAVIGGADTTDVMIVRQNVSRYDILDTVRTDPDGKMKYRVSVEKGNPDFFYLYSGGRKIASLLLEGGDKVEVSADTSGNYTVSGSPESEKLAEVERKYAGFCRVMDSLSAEVVKAGEDNARIDEVRKEIARSYTDYYRQCVRYIMTNSKSLTVVPVFYQTVANSFYVFSQDSDAIHFRNISDSLASVYPDSRYVKALRTEAENRSRQLEMRVRIEGAETIGFPDLELPDASGKKVKLSDVDAKVVLLHFWSSSDAVQKMFNLDVLKEIYAEYHPLGLEIYQVAVDVDKPSWERVVSAQKLEWINVCDGMGQNSPAVRMYNINRLPVSFIISGGQLSDEKVNDEKSLRKALDSLLK